MKTEETGEQRKDSGHEVIRCAGCRYFRRFDSARGHHSPHALGKCEGRPWDGNRGQWPMFPHHCEGFRSAAPRQS